MKKLTISDYKRLICYHRWITFGLIFYSIGILTQFMVITHNNGKMPVYDFYVGYDNKEYFRFDDFKEVKYPYFADIIPIGDYAKSSIGDIFIVLGVSSLLIGLFRFYRFWRNLR